MQLVIHARISMEYTLMNVSASEFYIHIQFLKISNSP